MKKILVGIITVILLTGCGMKDDEKEKLLYDSLEKAFTTIYINEGIGLGVYDTEKIEIENEIWYQVAISKYDSYSKITSLANEIYSEELAEEINLKTEKRYKEVDGTLYTKAEGGCPLKYQLDDKLRKNIKKDIKIKKIKMSKIIFELNGKEYTAKKNKDTYVFEEKIFECIN